MSRAPGETRLRPLKITVVGDGTVGKTCLLISYTINSFPEEYVPTVFDNHAKNLNVDGVEFSLTLWDTAGQEEYEKLRPLSYPKTDCFIICYAINNRASFANIESKWIPELKMHCPRAAIVLVGTKSDLDGGDTITEQEGKKLKSKIKANHFLQCSAKTRAGLDEVFVEAVRAVMKQKNRGNKTFCKYS
jgi:Ras-related C3 botulinum toxin substrate 1